MKELWLKVIVVAVVVVILTTFFVVIFWPSGTPNQQGATTYLEIQPDEQNMEVEKLYQAALLNTPGNSPEPSYDMMVASCRRIFIQHPNTPQAEKARELLRQYNMTDRQISRLYSSGPEVKKSRPLRRRLPRRDDEWHIANSNEVNPSN